MRLTYALCIRFVYPPILRMLSKGTKVSVKVETLVLFGATGDLAQRMLFPSLYNLHPDGLLASELTIIGSGRSKMDRAAFKVQDLGGLDEHLPADRLDQPGVKPVLHPNNYSTILA